MFKKMICFDGRRRDYLTSHVRGGDGSLVKTVCCSSVLTFFGVDLSTYGQAHTVAQVCEILSRNGWGSKDLSEFFGVERTMEGGGEVSLVYPFGVRRTGMLRKFLKGAFCGADYFLVWVEGHVMILNGYGETIIDTAPRKRDARKVFGVWKIERGA